MNIGLHPPVTCVIVNWNGGRDTVACLAALNKCTYPNLRIVVVDNGSTDDSVACIRGAHPSIAILQSGSNLGFAGGNNLGIRHALAHGSQYLWLLNNDTKPAADALTALVRRITEESRIGATASVCYYMDAPGTVQAWAGARVNLWLGYARNAVGPHSDEWFHSLYGASMLISSEAIRKVGLLDEGFFLYWEETEFCLRLRKHGWRLVPASESRVLHRVNASTGGSSLVLDRHFTASGLRILKLHSAIPPLSMMIFLASRLVRRLANLQFSRCASVWQGLMDYCSTLPVRQRTR